MILINIHSKGLLYFPLVLTLLQWNETVASSINWLASCHERHSHCAGCVCLLVWCVLVEEKKFARRCRYPSYVSIVERRRDKKRNKQNRRVPTNAAKWSIQMFCCCFTMEHDSAVASSSKDGVFLVRMTSWMEWESLLSWLEVVSPYKDSSHSMDPNEVMLGVGLWWPLCLLSLLLPMRMLEGGVDNDSGCIILAEYKRGAIPNVTFRSTLSACVMLPICCVRCPNGVATERPLKLWSVDEDCILMLAKQEESVLESEFLWASKSRELGFEFEPRAWPSELQMKGCCYEKLQVYSFLFRRCCVAIQNRPNSEINENDCLIFSLVVPRRPNHLWRTVEQRR